MGRSGMGDGQEMEGGWMKYKQKRDGRLTRDGRKMEGRWAEGGWEMDERRKKDGWKMGISGMGDGQEKKGR